MVSWQDANPCCVNNSTWEPDTHTVGLSVKIAYIFLTTIQIKKAKIVQYWNVQRNIERLLFFFSNSGIWIFFIPVLCFGDAIRSDHKSWVQLLRNMVVDRCVREKGKKGKDEDEGRIRKMDKRKNRKRKEMGGRVLRIRNTWWIWYHYRGKTNKDWRETLITSN